MRLRLAVVADVHHEVGDPPGGWHNPYEREGLLARLEAAFRDDVDAVVVLGDVTNRADAPSVAAVERVLARSPVPVWVVPGNHDGAGDAAVGDAVAGVGLRGGFEGVLPDLGPWADEPLVVCSHYPLLATEARLEALGVKWSGDLRNREELEARLKARSQPTVVLCGHLHVRDAIVDGAILQLGFGALVEYPCDVALVEFDGATVVRHARSLATRVPGDVRPAVVPDEQRFRFEAGWVEA